MEKKVTLWAARDKDGDLYFYEHKPVRDNEHGWWQSPVAFDCIFSDNLPSYLGERFGEHADSITYENEPLKIELTIKVKE